MKRKEKSRLVLQWRKPEQTNGIIKKYVLHFSDSDGGTRTYTMHSDVDKEYLTFEVTLPDVETEYKIKVSNIQTKLMQVLIAEVQSRWIIFCYGDDVDIP